MELDIILLPIVMFSGGVLVGLLIKINKYKWDNQEEQQELYNM